MHTSTSIVIGSTTVHQDAHGRYSLNDLHREAGGEKRHQPSDFLRLASTTDLITEIHSGDSRSAAVEVVNGGVARGTYVCRELVYAYAMWVSPAFHLKVIRAFDALATGHIPAPPARPLPATYLEALKALVVAEEERERLALETAQQQRKLAEQAPKVEAHARFLDASGTLSLRDAAKALGLREHAFILRLLQDGVLYRTQGSSRLRAYAEQETAGRFAHKAGTADSSGKEYVQVRVTPAGLEWLAKRYPAEAATA